MTNLRKSFSKRFVFCVLVLAVVLFEGCDKKQELSVENQEVYTLIEERGQTDLEALKEVEQALNLLVSGKTASGDEYPIFPQSKLGQRNDVRAIYYSADGSRTFVFPLVKDDETTNLFLVSEDSEHYILEKTDRLAKEDVIDTKISPYIARVFEVADYLSTDVPLSKTRAILGADYEIGKEGNVLIMKEKTTSPGKLARTRAGGIYVFCNLIVPAATEYYLDFFGWGNEYYDVVSGAVAASCANMGLCYCIPPERILEHLGLAGQDWFYDEDYWASDPTFPEQELPSYNDFFTHFPKHDDGRWLYGADEIYALAGGDVLEARLASPSSTGNTCALKVSIALNGAGIIIPNIPTTATDYGTVEGLNGKYYFLNAKSLSEWMKITFMNSYETITPTDYVDIDGFHGIIAGRTGITISIYGGGNDVSGHADIYTGTSCSNSPNNPSEACGIAGTIYFWELN